MPRLSVIIPGRNERFFAQTVENVLANMRGDTEVVAVCDGNWPEPALYDHPRLTVVKHESIGQRAATNEGVRISQSDFVMKLDAHCALAEGFDVVLMNECQPNWTMIPQMYGLHAFDWKCTACGDQTYQGSTPERCRTCFGTDFTTELVWKPREGRLTWSWIFDSEIHFQYSRQAERRVSPDAKLFETMSCIGCCMFLRRDRYWDLEGMDERHGSWGQYGVEIACKTWLSGGQMMVTRNTWQAHMFRTGNFSVGGHSSFPYPISGNDQERARQYSRDLWRNNRWPKQRYPLSWLVEKFWPVKGWNDEQLAEQKQRECSWLPVPVVS